MRLSRGAVDPLPEDFLDDLAFAAAHGRLNIVKALLDKGYDANARSGIFSKTTALTLAAIGNYANVVKILLEAGADAETRDEAEVTVLMRAASLGYIEPVKVLLDAGADVNARDNYGATPLMWGVMSYSVAVMKALLDAGADVHTKDKNGETASSKALYDRPRTFTIGRSEFSFARKNPRNDIVRLLKNAEGDSKTNHLV